MLHILYIECHRNENGINQKKCIDCLLWYDLNENNFGRNKTSKDGFNSRCKTCQKKKNDEYYLEHRENQIKQAQEWRKNNLDKCRISERKREGTPERVKYHREKSVYKRLKGNYKDWTRRNPEKLREYGEKRQHKNHNITVQEWEDCKKYFCHRCCYCGLKIEDHYITRNGKTKLGDFHKEHYDNNGLNDLSNCIPSCGSCNSHKWKFTFDEWYSKDNPIFSQERYDRIMKWVTEDYKQYIKSR